MAALYKKNLGIIVAIIISSTIFFIAVLSDITPLLRGPLPYPPEWQYAYYFVNTLSKAWVPLLAGFCILLFTLFLENRNEKYIEKKEIRLLSLLIILSFFFQISVLYFGRSGIGVLLQRTIDPQSSGYFTISTKINNPSLFLQNYADNVLNYPGHVRGHPPGMIILHWLINRIFLLFPYLNNFADNLSLGSNHVKLIWNTLSDYQKTGALLSGAIIIFMSNFAIIPLYFLAKYITGIKAALRASILFSVIPSFVLFIPMLDIIMPVFSILTLLFFIKSQKDNKLLYSFISGAIFSSGIFFSLSLLPILLIIFFLIFFKLLKKHSDLTKPTYQGLVFFSGFIVFQALLIMLFGYDFIGTENKIISGLAPRSYFFWLFYNLYDFFIFAGVPILIIFAISLKKIFSNTFSQNDFFNKLAVSFLLMLLIVDVSGICRAETGRIWLPFIPFLVLIVSKYLTYDLKFNRYSFITVLCVQIIQVLVIQEFWVMLW